MNIRQRGDAYELRAYINGKQVSFSGKTEAEVKKRYKDYKKEFELPPRRMPLQQCDMLVSEYVDFYLKTYKYETVKYSTYDRLESCYNNHIKDDEIGRKMLRKVTPDELQMYFNRKRSVLSLSSLKKIKEVLLPCFEHAMKSDYIVRNPLDGVRLPTNKNVNYGQLGNLVNHRLGGGCIRNLIDFNKIAVFHVTPAGTDLEGASAGLVVGAHLGRIKQNLAAGWEIRRRECAQEVTIRIADKGLGRITDLPQVKTADIAGHAGGNAGIVGHQDVGKRRRQQSRLLHGAVVVVHHIHGVKINIPE